MLPKSIQQLIWWGKVDSQIHADRIITAVFNHGTMQDIYYILNSYPVNTVQQIIQYPLRGSWDKKSLHFAEMLLGVKCTDSKEAIRSIML